MKDPPGASGWQYASHCLLGHEVNDQFDTGLYQATLDVQVEGSQVIIIFWNMPSHYPHFSIYRYEDMKISFFYQGFDILTAGLL